MAIKNKNHKICIALINTLVITTSMAQRPSFAGSRPSDGLNQKDKYYSTTPGNTDFQNRFGGSDSSTISNKIPFGQPQNPPVGYPVVAPESVYNALIPAATSNALNGVVFEDRFGETDTNTSTVRPVVPLDAHGDQQLIDQLNKLPVDKRPFWFLNYQAIEAQRNGSAIAGGQGSRGSFLG